MPPSVSSPLRRSRSGSPFSRSTATRDPVSTALFGSILGVTTTDVWILVGVAVFALLVVTLNYRRLLFTTFDADVAAVSGVNVGHVDALLMLVLSLSILSTLTVIGVTLVAATLVVPAVIARMLTVSFHRMLIISTVIGATSGFVGMNLSYHLDVPSGTTIVLVGAAIFGIVLAVTGGRTLRRTRDLDDVVDLPLVPVPSRNAER